MRYAVLGDIHGNLHALEAVLQHADSAGAEGLLCVGDVVGYGAFPGTCLEMIQEREGGLVGGNHDWAAVGRVDVRYFNAGARDSVHWTREHLEEEHLAALEDTELLATVGEITLVHSTLFAPGEFEYMQTMFDVQLCFGHLETRLCFCGHSHSPAFMFHNDEIECLVEPEFQLRPSQRAIVNVGSVGQPRDLDPRACYVLYDDKEQRMWLHRVEYDVRAAADAILDAGLPASNARRIVLGR